MLRNYVKIALRNVVKHKGYSFINITGLAVGIACCLLIFMYVKDEVTYDLYHEQANDTYRIVSEIEFGGELSPISATNAVEAKEYAESIPEIINFARMDNATILAKKDDDYIRQFGGVFADRSLFEMFQFEAISGALGSALEDLNTVVITRSNAIKYFGEVDVAGEELTLQLSGKIEQYVIDAVIEDLPSNTSLDAQFIFPWEKNVALGGIYKFPWQSIGVTSFVQLIDGADPEVVSEKIKSYKDNMNLSDDEGGDWIKGFVTSLQPLTGMHLAKKFNSGSPGVKEASDSNYSYVLSIIAVIILLLACINFANLSVARSLPRAKEIGVRKVLGARKKQVAFQFLSEALYISTIAFVVGLLMAELLLPVFGGLVNKQFTANVLSDPTLIVACFMLVMFTALVAGAYPSMIISRFSAIASLNGRVKMQGKQYVSKALVLLQFSLAGILVVGVITMNKQISYLVNYDLGYDDSNLVVVNIKDDANGQLLKNELASNPKISQMIMGSGYGRGSELTYNDIRLFTIESSQEQGYLEMIDVELLAGRQLQDNRDTYVTGTDTLNNILVNEAFLNKIGVERSEAINQILGDGRGNPQSRIVGVVKDFVFGNARNEVTPLAFQASSVIPLRQLSIKVHPEYITEIKADIEAAWRSIEPYEPIQLTFQDESNQSAFAEEERWKTIITYSTVLAIMISCLGLFGLAHQSALQRQKEIGVRKVLGASVQQLVILLNAGFSKLVLLSLFVTIPVSYYLASNWLDNFSNKINLGVLVFLIPAAITFGIATLTISMQSFKTANSNPVDSLRDE